MAAKEEKMEIFASLLGKNIIFEKRKGENMIYKYIITKMLSLSQSIPIII